jgi:acetyl esterase/lipase
MYWYRKKPALKLRVSFLIVAMLLLASTTVAQPFVQEPDIADVAYGDLERQVLDVFLPEDTEEPVPVLLAIHGGGYLFGDKRAVSRFSDHFADQGYAVVAPNYRLAPANPYPAPIEDLACALAWIHANPEGYPFDLSSVFIVGESAGGNAAALLGTTDALETYLSECPYADPDRESWIAGVIAYYPFIDFGTCEQNCDLAYQVSAFYLGLEEYSQDAWESASPLLQIDADDPPFLLIHGTADTIVPVRESIVFDEALSEAGVDSSLVLIEGAGHAFIELIGFNEAGTQSAEVALEWLRSFGV